MSSLSREAAQRIFSEQCHSSEQKIHPSDWQSHVREFAVEHKEKHIEEIMKSCPTDKALTR
jgi:hypothetical protein